MGDKEPIEDFRATNGISFPSSMRFIIELITLGVALGGFYWALSGRIDNMADKMSTLQEGQKRIEQSVKEGINDHDHRLDQLEQGTAPIITDMKDQIKELKRSKQTKRGE